MSGHTHFFHQVHHQLQKMSSIVQQIGEIVARETRYVEEMPLATFVEEDTETLLRQADDLIVCQVITHNSIINQTSRQLDKAKQSPEEVFFPNENWLPQVGFEPTTLCSLGITGHFQGLLFSWITPISLVV